MARKTIGVVSGSRAEYGLLRPLLKALFADSGLETRFYATGSHLDAGGTADEIAEDRIPVAERVPLGGGTVTDRMAAATARFGERFAAAPPDLLFLLGDRYEIFAVAAAAAVHRVPLAHLHGGERSDGAVDEAFRHAITKMSHLHFTSTEAYRRRVIRLGESPERVFNVGALGLENLHGLELPDREALEAELAFRFDDRTVVATFHPATQEPVEEAERQFAVLLEALERADLRFLITGANADRGGEAVNRMIAAYAAAHPERCKAVASLGTRRYFAAVRYSAGVVGNSSSGIIEVPALHRGTVDIGNRQKGRLAPSSVIHCDAEREAIAAALRHLLSPGFQAALPATVSPYGDGRGVAAKILREAKRALEEGIVPGKAFYDGEWRP